jgi:hypothetical protein
MAGVYNKRKLQNILKKASTQRVDIVGVHNSEGLQGGHGWDTAIQENLKNTYGVYATAVYSMLENKALGAGVGYWDSTTTSKVVQYIANSGLGTAVGNQVTTAASDYLQHMNWSAAPVADVGPNWPLHVPSGTNLATPTGLQINQSSVIPVAEALTFNFWGVNSDEAIGELKPIIRRANSPFTTLYTFPIVYYTGTLGTIRKSTYSLAADGARTYPIEFRTHEGWNPATMKGPLFLTYMRACRTNQANGIAFSPFYSLGGRSAYDMYMCLNAFPASSWQHYFDVLCEYQGASKANHYAVFDIYEGSNQAVETLVAAGAPVQATPSHVNNYVWYMQQIVAIIEAQWTASGRNVANIAFRMACSHPLNTAGTEATMETYRAALKSQLRFNAQEQRVCLVDYSELTTLASMVASNYFSDTIHLNRDGYIGLDSLAWIDILAEDTPVVVQPSQTISSLISTLDNSAE